MYNIIIQFLKIIYEYIIQCITIMFTNDEKVEFSFVYKVKSKTFNNNNYNRNHINIYAMKKILIQSELISKSVDAEIIALRKFNHTNIINLIDCTIILPTTTTNTYKNIHKIAYLLFPYVQC